MQVNKEVVMVEVTHYGHALRSAADPLEADKQVVKRHGLALYHAAPSLTADREVVMAAVERRSGVEVEWGSELKLGRSGGVCQSGTVHHVRE